MSEELTELVPAGIHDGKTAADFVAANMSAVQQCFDTKIAAYSAICTVWGETAESTWEEIWESWVNDQKLVVDLYRMSDLAIEMQPETMKIALEIKKAANMFLADVIRIFGHHQYAMPPHIKSKFLSFCLEVLKNSK